MLLQQVVVWSLIGPGSITQGGLYTVPANPSGVVRVVARLGALADTSEIRFAASSEMVGLPLSVSGYLVGGAPAGAVTGSLDGYQPDNICARIATARSRRMRLFLNLTGGAHAKYKTAGVFDETKWRATMDGYTTPPIRQCVTLAIADGTVRGASVMDEPHQDDTSGDLEKSWGPPGTLTKARVDGLCGYVKNIFPTLPVGVNHDHRHFEPAKDYRICDFLGTQYRASKGPVEAWRDGARAFAQRSGIRLLFGMNLLHGGAKRSDCAAPCDMTHTEARVFGLALGPYGCGLNMWRYDAAYFGDINNQGAFQVLADTLARLPQIGCGRP